MERIVGFIGAGNMAEALARGLTARGTPRERICASDPSPERRQVFGELAGRIFEENHAVVERAEILVLAVKPQVMANVLSEICSIVRSETLVVSIAAGLSTEFLRHFLPAVPLVRVMPNTPCLVGKGMSVLYAAPGVADADRASAEGIFTACGKTAWVNDEDLLDPVTALSGSGPAYFFRFCELLAEAGQRLGLAPELADMLAQETCFGAAAILETTGETPAALRRKVTSPGGTTEAALKVVAERGLSDTIEAALSAASHRAGELRTQAWEALR